MRTKAHVMSLLDNVLSDFIREHHGQQDYDRLMCSTAYHTFLVATTDAYQNLCIALQKRGANDTSL